MNLFRMDEGPSAASIFIRDFWSSSCAGITALLLFMQQMPPNSALDFQLNRYVMVPSSNACREDHREETESRLRAILSALPEPRLRIAHDCLSCGHARRFQGRRSPSGSWSRVAFET